MTQGYTNYIFAFYNCLLTLEQTRKHGNTIKCRRISVTLQSSFSLTKNDWPEIDPRSPQSS